MMQDLECQTSPYVPTLLAPGDALIPEALQRAPAEHRALAVAFGEEVVEAALGYPQDRHGRRHVARARWVETMRFDRTRTVWRLARAPATIRQATIDGSPMDLGDLLIYGATGSIRPRSGCWASGQELQVVYDGGWYTPVQVGDAPPTLPTALRRAALRAAALFIGELARSNWGVRSRREEVEELGLIETIFATPTPARLGVDPEIDAMVAPWRFYGLP